jgi:hypothetical protein
LPLTSRIQLSGQRELAPTCASMRYYQCFPRGTFVCVID